MKGRIWLLLAATALILVACGPGGPNYDDLAAEPVFAKTMPGATQVGGAGSDPDWTIEGSTYGFAVRSFASEVDAEDVLAWYRAALQADGWGIVGFAFISMRDGHQFQHAWRRGDLVMGLGFPRPDSFARIPGAAGAATVYEISITYQPAK